MHSIQYLQVLANLFDLPLLLFDSMNQNVLSHITPSFRDQRAS